MVCRQHPKHRHGGLATAAWATARAACDAGWRVVFATAKHPKGKKRSTESGVTVVWLPGCGHAPGAYPQFHHALSRAFPTLRKEFGFRLIHTHSSGAAPLIDGDLPVVFQDHGLRLSMAQNKINRACICEPEMSGKALTEITERVGEMYFASAPRLPVSESVFLRKCRRVLVLNTETLWEVRTRYLLTNAEVFHYPVYGLTAQTPPKRARPLVGFCASNLDNPEKGVAHGLRLLKPLAGRIDVRLIGPGKEVPALARQLFKAVECTGWIEQAQLVTKLGECDLLFESSNHHHGLNSTSVFALGLGVPVVGLPTPSSYEVTGDGVAGRIVSPFDAARASATVLSIVRSRNDRWRQRARARFDGLFSPAAAALALDRIYTEAV